MDLHPALEDPHALRAGFRSMNYAELAKYFGCSKKTLHSRLKKFNINRKNTPKDSPATVTIRKERLAYMEYTREGGDPCTPNCPGYEDCLADSDMPCYFSRPDVLRRVNNESD